MQDPKLLEFTMNEIRALVRINNPHVVKFFEMLKTENRYYFVYEYCNGGDLEGMMNKQGRLREDQAIQIFRQLLTAFKSLVNENILHRDIKPANILFHNGEAKLADFGFCKALTSRQDLTNSTVGSPLYMAPEVMFGKDYDSSSDIWSLGCVLFEMLYSKCPFETNNLTNLMLKLEKEDFQIPPQPSVS